MSLQDNNKKQSTKKIIQNLRKQDEFEQAMFDKGIRKTY